MPKLNDAAIAELNLAALKQTADTGLVDAWRRYDNSLAVVYDGDQNKRRTIAGVLSRDCGTWHNLFANNPDIAIPGQSPLIFDDVAARLAEVCDRTFAQERHQALRCGELWSLIILREMRDFGCDLFIRPDKLNLEIDVAMCLGIARALGKLKPHTRDRLNLELPGQTVTIYDSWTEAKIKHEIGTPKPSDVPNFKEVRPSIAIAAEQAGAVFRLWQSGRALEGTTLLDDGQGFRLVRNGWKITIQPETKP